MRHDISADDIVDALTVLAVAHANIDGRNHRHHLDLRGPRTWTPPAAPHRTRPDLAATTATRAPAAPRLPLDPLLADGHYTPTQLARAANLTTWQIRHMRTVGITLDDADTICINLGLHPAQIWGDAFYQHEPDAAA